MSDEPLPRLEALFAEALLREPGARDAFLAAACPDDEPLRRRVLELLRHHEAADSFLERPAVPARPADPLVHPVTPTVGTRLGPFEILGVLGRGGMGVVYRARQEQPGRVVALKLVRPGLVSERLIRRFEHEIELLGRLEHPGIARVYEAGAFPTAEGDEPYFAMELVEGLPLTEFAVRAGLDTRRRLALVAEVADAVQHAHERSVIHRDLKPGNILVDAAGRPRILDFGIARATDSDRQLTTVHTGVGEILGTLAYMSPEQLSGSGQLDTRADIYALGVIAYELVAGRLPHDIADKPLVEAITTLSHAEPPTLGSLDRGLRGDIEVIVAKAMDKDRERRYTSAAEFAADIRRFLADEPIVARPPSTTYQLRKLVARHRPLVAAALALFVVVTAFAVAMTFLYAESERNRVKAEQARRSAESVATFLANMLAEADPSGAKDANPTVRALLDAAAPKLDRELAQDPAVAATLHSTVGRSYRVLGRYAEADTHLTRSVALWRAQGDTLAPGYASAQNGLANLRRVQGKLDEAERLLRANLALRRRSAPGSEGLAETLSNLATLLTERNKLGEADTLMREVDALFHASLGLEHARRPDALNIWALIKQEQRDFAAADSLMEQSIGLYRKLFGPEHANVGTALASRALGLQRQNRLAEAEPYYRQAIAILRKAYDNRSPILSNNLANLGALLRQLNRPDEAEPLIREAIAMQRQMNPGVPDGWLVGQYLNNLAEVLEMQGHLPQSAALFEEAIATLGRGLGPTHHRVARARATYGRVLGELRRYPDGERELLEAVRLLDASLGARADRSVKARKDLADLYDRWGRTAEAAAVRRQLTEQG